jgi:integrase
LLKATPRLGDHVWTDNGKTHVSGFSKAKARLDAYLAAGQSRQNVAINPWVLHDIRRTVATHMVRLGVPELVVGRVLNHAVQGVTGKVYALHSYGPEKRSALERWAADLEREVAGRKPSKVVKLKVAK